MRNFETLTVKELREEAKLAGLKVSGTKAELIERLTAYYVEVPFETVEETTAKTEAPVVTTTGDPEDNIILEDEDDTQQVENTAETIAKTEGPVEEATETEKVPVYCWDKDGNKVIKNITKLSATNLGVTGYQVTKVISRLKGYDFLYINDFNEVGIHEQGCKIYVCRNQGYDFTGKFIVDEENLNKAIKNSFILPNEAVEKGITAIKLLLWQTGIFTPAQLPNGKKKVNGELVPVYKQVWVCSNLVLKYYNKYANQLTGWYVFSGKAFRENAQEYYKSVTDKKLKGLMKPFMDLMEEANLEEK